MSHPALQRPSPERQRLWEVVRLFLKLGATGFGGPAVTIAMMEDEVVTRRRWLSREQFLDLVGLTNVIPGPNATEIAIHVGYLHAGWPGLLLAGLGFILPAMLLSLALGWLYLRVGALPAVSPILAGIKPAVLAVIALAVYRLTGTALRSPLRATRWTLAALMAAVLVASLLGANEIVALFAGGLLGMVWLRWAEHRREQAPPPTGAPPLALLLPAGLGHSGRTGRPLWSDVAERLARAWATPWGPLLPALAQRAAPTLGRLALFFLKVGSVMYGSGYVLIAFLEGGLVQQYGWLTQGQLLDAVAVGQLTPGPLLSTSTFIGYVLLGVPGAVLATAGVFFPSFVFVALLGPLLPILRRSPWTGSFLDAVNACALGLMAAVGLKMALNTVTSWPAAAIAALALLAALRWRLNSAWLVLGGGLLGALAAALGLL
ncbi:MAG: chromate efflux transporter [Anaerolineae bacterium]|jgi:chromate transporter|nr:chromate efflux transporter [Chloroflexota bacterium]